MEAFNEGSEGSDLRTEGEGRPPKDAMTPAMGGGASSGGGGGGEGGGSVRRGTGGRGSEGSRKREELGPVCS